MSLLKEFNEEMITVFSKDLFFLMNTVKRLDEAYADGREQFSEDLKHFKKLITMWNKKYPLLFVKDYEDGMQLKLKVIIREENIYNLVLAATKIEGLDSINKKKISLDKYKIESYLPKDAKRIELVYSSEENTDENTLTFETEKNGIILVYSQKDMLKIGSPEFEICSYYGLKSNDLSINLQKFSSMFSFDTDFEEQEGKGEGYLNRVRLFDRV